MSNENNFSGVIPPDVGDLNAMKELNLGDNRLSGEIQKESPFASVLVMLGFIEWMLTPEFRPTFSRIFRLMRY
ncbi:hypothetical protein TrLO_g1622 [Triparma laevis f. longispina]|uniref:Uncharacterized protein n=1 Tax=Triparma laevis f. longispina TaxID=1714387 RepID=A0A9W7AM39_9STRA|nr:hypothetical protein TrLO_g1622 [Triparma laevis f. longispina]